MAMESASQLGDSVERTELVQAMGQPSSGVTGLLSRGFVRPAMKLSPDFVKTPMFNAVLRYSLGLPLRASSS